MSSAPVLSSEPTYDRTPVAKRTLPDYSKQELRQVYNIEKIADYIIEHDFKVPCLQFPDKLVQTSSQIASEVSECLKGRHEAKVQILADTAYSPCCVDEIAAQHVRGDVVFHFGNSCLNPVRDTPVVYVMENKTVDASALAEKLRPQLEAPNTIIYADTDLTWLGADLAKRFDSSVFAMPNAGTFIPPLPESQGEQSFLPNRKHAVVDTPSEAHLVYLSSGEPSDSLLLHLATLVSELSVFDVSKPECPQITPQVALQRRYRFVQMAKAAGTIGILVNTLSLRYMTEVLETVKRWITQSDKKYYTFVVGKPNTPKLANFEAIDMWVVLGCPVGGIILDSSEFIKPIITPHELQMALSDTWNGTWLVKFEDALKLDEPDRESDQEEEPLFDSVTGKLVTSNRPLRSVNHLEIETDEERALYGASQSLTIKNTTSTAAEYLKTKSWQGLGTDHSGHEEYADLKVGRSGIARDYNHDT